MEELMNMFKTRNFKRTAMADYKRLSKANLIDIDDIMIFPVEKNHAVALFNFINGHYEKTSFIITTKKKPTERASMIQDEVLATALLNRILYQCEIINLTGQKLSITKQENHILKTLKTNLILSTLHSLLPKVLHCCFPATLQSSIR